MNNHRAWFPVPQWCLELQRQLREERAAQHHGLPCVVGGLSTTSVRLAKKMARWDA